jgi:hypothetical protein
MYLYTSAKVGKNGGVQSIGDVFAYLQGKQFCKAFFLISIAINLLGFFFAAKKPKRQ